MNQNTRRNLRVYAVVSAVIIGVAWLIPVSKEPQIWWVRIGASSLMGLILLFYLWATLKRDMAPDFLRKAGRMFERDGFTFVIGTEVIEGVCHLRVHYQNRYELPCQASVMVRTTDRTRPPQKFLPDAAVSVRCDAGAYGMAVSPWALPKELQGQKVLVEVLAKRTYPYGRGKLIRFRNGRSTKPVPRYPPPKPRRLSSIFGALCPGGSARMRILLPTDVATTVSIDRDPPTQTIWKLGDPVNKAKSDGAA